jgi:hypothetical protein
MGIAIVPLGAAIGVHFTLYFPGEKRVVEKEKYMERFPWLRFIPDILFYIDRKLLERKKFLLGLLYLPATLATVGVPYFAEVLIRVELSEFGYRGVLAKEAPVEALLFFAYGFIVMLWLALYLISNLVSGYLRAETEIQRKQVFLLFLGFLVPAVPAILFTILLPASGIPNDLYGWQWFIIAPPLLTYAMTRYRLFAPPSAEAIAPGKPKYSLRPGFTYLVKETRPLHSLEIFADLVSHGIPGICITRTYPNALRRKLRLKIPMIWIAQSRRSHATTSLREIADAVDDFARSVEWGVIFLDGLEYLITRYGFKRVLRLVHDLSEISLQRKSSLLLSVNPKIMEQRESAILEREMEMI